MSHAEAYGIYVEYPPQVDWALFGQTLQVAASVLNEVAHSVLDLTEVEGREPFSAFDGDAIHDSRFVVLPRNVGARF